MAKRNGTQEEPQETTAEAGTVKREVVDITGNVVRDPELRYTPGGKAICNVRLAVDGSDGSTQFFTAAAWENLADVVALVKKGDRLGVRGPLEHRPWTGHDGAERTENVVTAWVLHLHRRKVAGSGEAG